MRAFDVSPDGGSEVGGGGEARPPGAACFAVGREAQWAARTDPYAFTSIGCGLQGPQGPDARAVPSGGISVAPIPSAL